MSIGVRIGHNVLVRSTGDNVLFWNGRTEASRLISCGAVLDGSITREFRRWEDVAKDIAGKLQCPFGVVERDYRPIIEGLVSDGLVTIEGGECGGAVSGDCICGALAANATEKEASADFYKMSQLPSELHIDLTTACTERCVHCYLPDYANQFLDYALVDKALVEFRQMQGLTVYLTGGECMLHPDFAQICQRCRVLDLNFVVMSNLTMCGEKVISVLQKTEPQYVNVSLYSMEAKEHDAITRREGSWRETMEAILACENADVHIRLAAPLLKGNRTAILKLKEFADAHHMHLVTDCCIFPRCDHSADNVDHACSARELEEALIQNKDIFDRGWRESALPKCDAKVCEIGDVRICLNARGEYYPCDGMQGYVLGNVRTHKLEDVWHGDSMNMLRDLRNRDFAKCVTCVHRTFCKVCPAYNFNATGKLTETIPAQCELAEVIHKVYGGR